MNRSLKFKLSLLTSVLFIALAGVKFNRVFLDTLNQTGDIKNLLLIAIIPALVAVLLTILAVTAVLLHSRKG